MTAKTDPKVNGQTIDGQALNGQAFNGQSPRRIGRPPMNLPDAGHKMAALVRRIRKTRRNGATHAEILEVLNGSGKSKPISLVYFRSMISDRWHRFHRRLDPKVFEIYRGVLIRHYGFRSRRANAR